MLEERQQQLPDGAGAAKTRGPAWPFAPIVSLNGLDPDLIKQRSEVVYPTILLGLVLLNSSVAFAAFYIASGVFFPALETGQRVFAGALVGLIVGFVDWMIIAWHPSLPRWFVAGLLRPFLQPAKSVALALPVVGLCLLGFWAWAPDFTWPQRVFLSLLVGVIAGVAHFIFLWHRLQRTPEVDEHGYPLMPDFLERLLPFMVRLLLTALLSVVIGTGLSIAMNVDAVELARTVTAEEAAGAAKDEEQKREQQVLDDEYAASLEEVTNYVANIKQWTEVDTRLGETIEKRGDSVIEANAAFERSGEKVRCERGEQVPGWGECTGRAGDRGHTAAVEAEKVALDVWTKAQESKQDAEKDQEDHQKTRPVAPVSPVRGIAMAETATAEEIAEHRAGMRGLAATLRSVDKAAELQAWPWWARWGPEGVIFIIDIIPVLLKLLLGFQEVERRMWRRDADEVYASLNHRRISSWLAAAATGATLHQQQALARVAQIRGEADIIVAELNRDTDVEIARKQANTRTTITDLQEAAFLELSRERLDNSLETARTQPVAPPAGIATVKAETTPDMDESAAPTAEAAERPRPQAPAQADTTSLAGLTKYSWFGQPYVFGPKLSEEGEDSAHPVHLAVRLPQDREFGNTITTMSTLISKCAVVKSKGAGTSEKDWVRILRRYEDPLGMVNRTGLYMASDGHLLNRFYQPRGDLRQYVRQLHTEQINISHLQLTLWMSELADQVGQLHGNGELHNDLKPANVLATGAMANQQKSLAGPAFGSLVLTDFDLSCQERHARTTLPLTANYAAPECLDPNLPGSYRLGSKEADIFGLGAILLYLLTGSAVNALIQDETGRIKPATAGWHRAYKSAIGQTLSDVVIATPGPGPLVDLLSGMLAPDPSARPGIDEVQARLTDLRYSIPSGEYPAPYDAHAREPQGISRHLINLFTQLGYRLELNTKDFS